MRVLSTPSTYVRVGWRPGGLFRLSTGVGPVPYRAVRADRPGDRVSPGRRPALVVGLHGFGADERQVGSMLALDVPGPVVVLAPRGPEPEGPGFSWFGLDLADGRPEPRPGALAEAVGRVGAFAAAAARAWGADPGRVALVGYSQGGTVALAAAQAEGSPFAAVAALAGGLGSPGPPRVPLFLGVGTLDPFTDVGDVRARVASWAGADVTVSEADVPHVVAARHRADLSAWLRDRLSLG